MEATKKKKKAEAGTARYEELKDMLEERRRQILSQVHEKIRDVRTENVSGKVNAVLDPGESSEADIQEDIEFALIQMKAETLNKINEALRRLEEGAYGNCFECGEEISRQRLRALPFAVRCMDCEEARENAAEARADDGAAPRRLGAVLRHVELIAASKPARPGRRGPPAPAAFLFRQSVPKRERGGMSDDPEAPMFDDAWAGSGPLSIPPELPVLPLRDTVLFPNSFMPLAVARESSVRLIDEAISGGKLIAVFTQRDATVEEPGQEDLLPHRHRDAHPQDVQAARRQPPPDRPGAGAAAAGAGRLAQALPPRRGRRRRARPCATRTSSRSTRSSATSRPTSSRSCRCRRSSPTTCRRSR